MARDRPVSSPPRLAPGRRCDPNAAYDPDRAVPGGDGGQLPAIADDRAGGIGGRTPRLSAAAPAPAPTSQPRRSSSALTGQRRVRTCLRSPTGTGRSRSALLPVRRSPARWRRARAPKRRTSCTPRPWRCRRRRRRLGALSRPARPSLSERRGGRLQAAQPAPTTLRRRPAQPLLTLERDRRRSRASRPVIRLGRARPAGGSGCGRRRRRTGSPSATPRRRPAPAAAGRSR